MDFHTDQTLLQYFELIKSIRMGHNKIITKKIKHDFLRIMKKQIAQGESSKTPELTRYLHILKTTKGFQYHIEELKREADKDYDTIEAHIIALINEGIMNEGKTSFPEFKDSFSKISYFNKIHHLKNPDPIMMKLRNYNLRTEKYIKSNNANRQIADFILFLKLEVIGIR
tara:strand:- start:33 stop:542 length:510 start_codon:yes stop_codon:yes gene_type:complete